MIKKLIDAALTQSALSKQQDRLQTLRQGLIRHEARVGGRVFGEVPKGHKRDFFCLDRHTWIWHEEWIDANGERHIVATRYDVRPGNGVLKSQNGGHYQQATPDEVRRLHSAAHIYVDRVKREVYNFAS
jgi:hypothetical protein